MKLSLLPLLLLLVTSIGSLAEQFNYDDLQMSDYEEMDKRVQAKIKLSKKLLREVKSDEPSEEDQKAIEPLREALVIILSRPNQDNMVSKLLPEVRKELVHLNAFEDTVASISSGAMAGLENDKLTEVTRATHLIVIENIVSEFAPEVDNKENDEFRQIFTKIRDAKIKIPDAVRKRLKLRSMLELKSPSDRADNALKKYSSKDATKK